MSYQLTGVECLQTLAPPLMLIGYESCMNLKIKGYSLVSLLLNHSEKDHRLNGSSATYTFRYEGEAVCVDAHKNWGTLLFFRGTRISKNKRSPMRTHTHTLRHTSSLSNPSTNSPLVEGVHCFSFILISPSPLFKIHIRFFELATIRGTEAEHHPANALCLPRFVT